MSAASTVGKTRDHLPKEPNVLNVVLGNLLIKPWYPSFYPEDLVGKVVDRLYVCQACFRYSKELMPFLAHMKVCPQKEQPPPGNLIYASQDYLVYEVDGEDHKLYCQNLSLFAKLFLDTKSVFYDVTTFRYYLLVLNNPDSLQKQVVGFFSKEKMSWDNNNVACILVFPPWQKRGFGQTLMGVSYHLSKQEGRLGGPEKPLSTLGKRAYVAYWSASVCRSILRHQHGEMTIAQMVQDTWIQPEDIVTALKEMGVVESIKEPDGRVMLIKSKVRAWAKAHSVPMDSPIDAYSFTKSQDEEDQNDSEET